MSLVAQRAGEILKRLPPGPVRVAEVGVWRGSLSEYLLRARPDLSLLMVDRWAPPEPDSLYARSGDQTALSTADEMLAAMQHTQERTAFAGERAIMCHGESIAMAAQVPVESLDCGFLDAEHTRQAVALDLIAWWPKIKPGGFISGHDWEHPGHRGEWGVRQAVEEFIAEFEIDGDLELGTDHTWFLGKRDPEALRERLATMAGGRADTAAQLVYTAFFGRAYARFAQTLQRSVEANCPTTIFIGEELRIPPGRSGIPEHATRNTAKFHAWCRVVQVTEHPVVLMDADTVVLGDLAEAFEGAASPSGEQDWDVAYTERPGRLPINGGVIFVRPTPGARAFFAHCQRINDELMADPERLDAAVHKYGGVNQAAMNLLIADLPAQITVAALPCAIWNSVSQTWDQFGPDTRVLHVSWHLRRLVQAARVPTEPEFAPLAPLIKAYLQHARG